MEDYEVTNDNGLTGDEVNDYVVETTGESQTDDSNNELNNGVSETDNNAEQTDSGKTEQNNNEDNTTGESNNGTEEVKEDAKQEDERIIDALRRIISNESETESSSDLEEETPVTDNEPSEEVEEQQIDYSSTLNSILNELEDANDNYESILTYIQTQEENNDMNSTLSSQSATNVLLCVVIVILLVDIVCHFAKGVL